MPVTALAFASVSAAVVAAGSAVMSGYRAHEHVVTHTFVCTTMRSLTRSPFSRFQERTFFPGDSRYVQEVFRPTSSTTTIDW